MLTECSTSKKPAQMVWASVWLDECGHPRRSELVIMERNPDTPRGGYSAQSYIEALKKGLLPHWRHSQYFMQDNAGIHRSRAVLAFLHITALSTSGGFFKSLCISTTHSITTWVSLRRNEMDSATRCASAGRASLRSSSSDSSCQCLHK
jgi:hypothetical protein